MPPDSSFLDGLTTNLFSRVNPPPAQGGTGMGGGGGGEAPAPTQLTVWPKEQQPPEAPKTVEGDPTAQRDRYQTWPERLVRGIWEGILVPGDVAQGKTNIQPEKPGQLSDVDESKRLATEETLIDRVGNLAGVVTGGRIPQVAAETLTRGAAPLAEAGASKDAALLVARKLPDGSIRYGEPGQVHSDLMTKSELAAATDSPEVARSMGYALQGGKFLNRDDALKYAQKHEPQRAAWSAQQPEFGLDAATYNEATKLKPRSDGGTLGIGGGKLPASPAAAQPSADAVRTLSDDLYKLRTNATADKIEVSQALDKMPPEFKTAATQEKFYQKLERPDLPLGPEEQQAFDQFIVPMRTEIQKLSQQAGKYNMPLEDNEWVHRVMKGKEGEPGVGGAADLPQMGTKTLPRKTSAMMPRSLYVLEAQDGRRAVVSQPRPGFITVWNKGKGTTTKWGDDLELGNPIMVQGKRFTVKQAKTTELEADTPYRFQKSAAVNMADALVKMRATVRNIEYLDALTKSPEWLDWATKGNRAPAGWRTPDIPQLKEWKVHPKLANAFDDFYSPGIESKGVLEPLRKVNRFAVGTLFWNPIPHAENVAGHWFVARGWDWLKPTPWYQVFTEGARAIKSVITLDKDYVRLLKEGNALIVGGVQNADFYRAMAKKFGLEVQRNEAEWLKIANKFGLGVPELVRAWYAGMNRVLWQASDIFMAQRVFELERRGMATADAIKEAEKHIPNYRIPPEVLGSRMFSKIMQDPAITSFGRYHYGMWNSYTNMVRDFVGTGKTPQQRIDAIGNMMALGSLAFVVYPMVSYALQKLTGDEDIKKLPRGPAGIPTALYDSLSGGEKSIYDVIGNSITLAPVFKEGLQQMTNRDFFTGQHITEPGETNPLRKAAQAVEHGAQAMVAPYAQAVQTAKAIDERGVPREILKQAIGTQDRTSDQRRGRAKGQKIERGQAKRRRKKPRGVIEQFGGSLE